MRYTTPTDSSPGMAKPRFSTVGFDCELPPEARNEFFPPRRPHTPPIGPIKAPRDWRGLALAVSGLALCAVTLTSLWRHPSQPVQPQSAPTAIASATAPAVQVSVVQTPEVRRAEPVPLVVKRAERVLRLGKWNQVWMPDGALTWVRFLGIKDTFSDLRATRRWATHGASRKVDSRLYGSGTLCRGT